MPRAPATTNCGPRSIASWPSTMRPTGSCARMRRARCTCAQPSPMRRKPPLEHADEGALDVRGRLALFILVCDAVQHAHQKGVIHCDLKPANILVSSAAATGVIPTSTRATQGAPPAQPKILDFGVARVT